MCYSGRPMADDGQNMGMLPSKAMGRVNNMNCWS